MVPQSSCFVLTSFVLLFFTQFLAIAVIFFTSTNAMHSRRDFFLSSRVPYFSDICSLWFGMSAFFSVQNFSSHSLYIVGVAFVVISSLNLCCIHLLFSRCYCVFFFVLSYSVSILTTTNLFITTLSNCVVCMGFLSFSQLCQDSVHSLKSLNADAFSSKMFESLRERWTKWK